MAWADDPAYCTRDEVFQLALSAKAFVVRAQRVDAVATTTGVITLKAHGLADDDYVTLEVTSGGSLATGLAAATMYPVAPVSFDLLRLCNPSTLAPITSYVSGGSGWSIAVDLMRRLDLHRRAQAARINEALIAHSPPLAEPYPRTVVELNARMTARTMISTLLFDNAAHKVSLDRLNALFEHDERLLDQWRAGKPLHPAVADQTAYADNGARAIAGRTVSPWTTGTL